MSIGELIASERHRRGWSQDRLAALLRDASGRPTVTRDEVARLERGRRTPSRLWLPWLAGVLDLEVERLEQVTYGTDSEPKMQAAASVDELQQRISSAAAVNEDTISLLTAQTNQIRQIDRMLGARTAAAQMRGHLAALDQLRTFSISAGQRAPLARLCADAATLAGWQCLDLGDMGQAWRHHETAKAAGRDGGATPELTHAIAEQAYILIDLGDAASALELVEYARAEAGGAVAPLLRAWLSAVIGEIHAILGNAVYSCRAFDTAERLLPRDNEDPNLPFIVLNEVHLTRWRGNATARLGEVTAIEQLRRALRSLDPSFMRARAGLHVDLAHALVAAGDRDDAWSELNEAKRIAAQVGSARQARRVRELESSMTGA